MYCPYCAEPDTRVIDSRLTDGGSGVRRRRECSVCTRRFTTFERQLQKPLVVVKKNGQREIFDRDKMLRGILKACEKRTIPVETLEPIPGAIEQEVREEGYDEVPATRLGEKVMEKLKTIDRIAYIRFASVYREFRDVDQFMDILSTFQKNTDK